VYLEWERDGGRAMKGVLLAACSLVMLIPTAAFAASWVMWSRTGLVGEPWGWKIEDTYDPFLSQKACHTEARDLVKYLAQRRRAENYKVAVSAYGFAMQFQPNIPVTRKTGPPMVIQFRCWPAGGDPR
jgi:hypothetical protein